MINYIKQEFACVFDRDPAAQSYFEILTTYPGVHALLAHRVSHRLWNFGLRWPARLISYLSRWFTGIEIHPGAQIGHRFFIDHGMGVVIGETATIGDDCTLYHGVTLGGTSWNKGKRHPTLGNRVVIGAGAKVLGPITVGDDARIGSNSVVLKQVAPGDTVVGIPGHPVNPDRKAHEAKRLELATKFGFDAYGMSTEMPDPVAYAINHLFDHMQELDGQIALLKEALQTTGCKLNDTPLSELKNCQIRDNDGDA